MEKIKNYINDNPIKCLLMVMMIQIMVIIILGCMKCNFHQDELYTLETAHYMADSTPENVYMHQTDIFSEKTWLNVDDFKGMLTVDSESIVTTDDASSLTKKVIFGDTYELLVNVLCGLFVPGAVSKWIGIIINIPFILLSQWLLCKLTLGISNKNSVALASIIIYGFSAISLGFSVYTRFYCFVISMIITAMYLHFVMYKSDKIWKIITWEIIAYFCLLRGLMSSELVAIIIIGMYASYFVAVLLGKKWKNLIIHITPVVLGFGFFIKEYFEYFLRIVKYPERYIHEGEPLDLMLNGIKSLGARELVKRVYKFALYLGDYLFGSVIVLVIICAMIVALVVIRRKRAKDYEIPEEGVREKNVYNNGTEVQGNPSVINETVKTVNSELSVNTETNDSVVSLVNVDNASTSKIDTFIYVVLGTVIVYSIFAVAVALWLPRYYALIYPLIIVILVCVIDKLCENQSATIKGLVIAVFALGIVLGPVLGHVDNVFINEKDSIRKLQESEVCDNVIWNLDDFQIIMECVYQRPEGSRMYVTSEYESLNYANFDKEFLLWVSKSSPLSQENIDEFERNGYSVVEDFGKVADANIYYCRKI